MDHLCGIRHRHRAIGYHFVNLVLGVHPPLTNRHGAFHAQGRWQFQPRSKGRGAAFYVLDALRRVISRTPDQFGNERLAHVAPVKGALMPK